MTRAITHLALAAASAWLVATGCRSQSHAGERLPDTSEEPAQQARGATGLVPALAPGEFEVEPRTLAWSDVDPEHFDLEWRIPDGPRLAGDGFVADLERLLAVRFDPVELPGAPDAQGGEQAGERDPRFAAPPAKATSFGDLAAAAFEVPRAERRAWLAALPPIPALEPWPDVLAELCDDAVLFGDWDPDEDDAADGMWRAPAWEIDAAPFDERPVQQYAALFRADLAALKAAENDYRQYPRNVAANYDAIAPVRGSHFRGTDAADQPFSVLGVTFTSDLPFPFGDYTTDLDVLNVVAADGAFVTFIHSASDDFNWLAGRDVFLPVTTSEGAYVGLLNARQFGFDLDNVPDGQGDVRAGLRAALGNLKRNAEAIFVAHADPPRNDARALTEFRLLGAE